ncbi:MAG TPA: DUF2842 domain-containing protein [Stellaceae bacterium]|nr:DUF2842 domain-containing protein [Stellaceae bacterium]
MRLRILFGTLFLVGGLALYGLAIAALAAHVTPPGPLAAFVFYALAGTVWVAPAGWLVRWMQRAAPYRPPPEG